MSYTGIDVFVLLADGSGTTFSSDTPWGVAVTTEEEAKRYVEQGGIGYSHSYAKVRIFETYNEAREAIYGDQMRKYKSRYAKPKGETL